MLDRIYTNDVFGISRSVHNLSYVDRANLDKKISKLLHRETHIALKGASKTGKSWLRQKCISDSIVVQSRLNMTVQDIYRNALSQLGQSFNATKTKKNKTQGSIDGQLEFSIPLITSAQAGGQVCVERESSCVSEDFNSSIDNLEFIANVINRSGKRLIIEDFHYLSLDERRKLAYDLKTLWDFGCFIIIIGVWTQTNLLTSMNPDLTGRIEEVTVSWSDNDLLEVIQKGAAALNLKIGIEIQSNLVKDSFGNVGILQTLLLKLIEDEADIEYSSLLIKSITNMAFLNNAARNYANQLDGAYQQFAELLSTGIRHRKKSTGIYAYVMEAIVSAPDAKLINGFSRDEIYNIIHTKENRIQKGNLRTVMRKLVELQEPTSERNLVISYDESIDSIFVVDLQLLFYRKYHTMNWPWEILVEEAKQLSLFDPEYEI